MDKEVISTLSLRQKADATITGYVTDVITDLTIDRLDQKRGKEKPFMMMYLHMSPSLKTGQVRVEKR